MNMMTIRKSAVAGLAAVAMISAGSLAAPTQAHAGGKAVAAFVGGALLGGLIASHATPVYGAPVVYGPTCYWQKQKVWYPNPGYYAWQNVKVCY